MSEEHESTEGTEGREEGEQEGLSPEEKLEIVVRASEKVSGGLSGLVFEQWRDVLQPYHEALESIGRQFSDDMGKVLDGLQDDIAKIAQAAAPAITLPEVNTVSGFSYEPMLVDSHPEYADTFVQRLERQIEDLRRELDESKGLLVTVLLPGNREIPVTFFGYHNPNLIAVHGLGPDGSEVRVLVHQNSLQLLCSVVDKHKAPKRTIGFQPLEKREPKE